MKIKLSQWAKSNNYSYQGAYNLFKSGKLKGTQLKTGTILIDVVSNTPNLNYVIYARVSSNKQKDDLERQIERLKLYCISNGYIIDRIYKEVASGMNDNRRQLNKLIDNANNTIIIVENKDRLTRFGFNYLEQLFKLKYSKIEVVNKVNDDNEDLINDLVSVVTSFCARLYSRRKVKNKTDKIKNILNDKND